MNDEVIERFDVEEVGDKMYSSKTKRFMDTLLLSVVEDEGGTARRIRNKSYKIAGKTGTAYISQGRSGYANGARCTFAGFFPADNPKYTCVVVIDNPRVNSSGAGVSAPVFKEISDRAVAIMAREIEMESNEEQEVHTTPVAKNGYAKDLTTVCDELDICVTDLSSREWVKTERNSKTDELKMTDLTIKENLIPNVVGMGVRDAVYLMESLGVRCTVTGVGRVFSQSLPVGSKIIKGSEINLRLR